MAIKELTAGARIRVAARLGSWHAGLHYPSFEGVLLDDAGVSEGWDVVDVMRDDGVEQSVYCFSIVRDDAGQFEDESECE